ncbi:nitric oxide reductase transcriptional regulator NorR [Algibacillus agarilyticus]|uniref:nitric oxide reductase transcriptional regulator NorR n=1 Tax=Algibacillus agarilyticus TaxID=2234133 RepID=UPI000DD038DA|nr:nitric oxide reductase transcriptional regulator NorR [Algibacillus agarilyticus]
MQAITSESLLNLVLNLGLNFANSLADNLSEQERYHGLLDTISKTIECDAIAILAFRGDILKPLATKGLSQDTMGRRFVVAEHPRFVEICQAKTPTRFFADCPLPDPYDGLVVDMQGDLPIHACMGIPLYFADKLIGILTLDSFTPNAFDTIAQDTLEIIAAISSATLNTALMIELMEHQALHSKQVVAELSQSVLLRDSGELIGDSPLMLALKKDIDIVAASPFTVLISGATGVGKELVARQIHHKSSRSDKPLVYVNCAALPENLIESELFGHVKGAFTGADKDRSGKFILADGGTLFLDEIGELPLAAQSKLLRVLQNQEIQTVGQDKIRTVDVRVIAATNRNLIEEVERGRFRADLYHRLSVYPINVPPLKARENDVILLAGYFAESARRKLGLSQVKLTTDLLTQLSRYAWPGNVRELEHVIDRAAIKAREAQMSSTITLEGASVDLMQKDQSEAVLLAHEVNDAPSISSVANHDASRLAPHLVDSYSSSFSANKSLKEATQAFQQQLIMQTLVEQDHNMAATARILQTDRANLSRLAKKLGIVIKKRVG